MISSQRGVQEGNDGDDDFSVGVKVTGIHYHKTNRRLGAT